MTKKIPTKWMFSILRKCPHPKALCTGRPVFHSVKAGTEGTLWIGSLMGLFNLMAFQDLSVLGPERRPGWRRTIPDREMAL
jgi:hypothetical protein